MAQVPATLSYQGLLTDAAGMPFKDDPYSIVFRFYKQATGGTEEFSRGPITVTTFKGLFTTMLGNGPGADNAALPYTLGDSQYYIGISVGAQPELTPRVFLTAVPYAFHAQTVSVIDFSSTSVTLTGTVPTARLDANLQDLSDGSLTGSKVGTGISATNITTGILTGSLVGTGISATNVTTGTLPNTVLDTNLIDLADGSLTGSKVGTGISASNITTGTLSLTGTDATKLASGTTAQRPGSPVEGQIRYNSTEKVMEYYNATNWYFIAPKVAFLKEERSNGLNGGDFSNGVWVTRILNNQEGDNFVTLNTNKFTLPSGQYIIEVSAPAFGVTNHKIRLQNFADNTFIYGGSSFTNNGVYSQTNSQLFTAISISATTSFEIQHKCSTQRLGDGLGTGAPGIEGAETYTQVKITKLR